MEQNDLAFAKSVDRLVTTIMPGATQEKRIDAEAAFANFALMVTAKTLESIDERQEKKPGIQWLKPVVRRLKEPSTWASLAVLAVSAGITPEDWVQISAVGVAVTGAILGIVFREKGGAK